MRERVHDTTLSAAPDRRGLRPHRRRSAGVAAELARVLADAPATDESRRPRLPVDRVFTVAGFGTVVTGTLSGGEIATGDELRLYPGQRTARVRGLQSHQAKVARALPGSRTAVNLSGVTTEDVHRGDVLAPPGLMRPGQRLDARLRLLASSPVSLKQNDEVDFFTGAAELPARVTLLDRERLDPGDSAWVQLRFRAPIAVLKGDRFIVRRASPSETIGGGEIVDANPVRHKRFRPETVAALETLAAGSPDEIVLQVLEQRPIELRELRTGVAGLEPGGDRRGPGSAHSRGGRRRLRDSFWPPGRERLPRRDHVVAGPEQPPHQRPERVSRRAAITTGNRPRGGSGPAGH